MQGSLRTSGRRAWKTLLMELDRLGDQPSNMHMQEHAAHMEKLLQLEPQEPAHVLDASQSECSHIP